MGEQTELLHTWCDGRKTLVQRGPYLHFEFDGDVIHSSVPVGGPELIAEFARVVRELAVVKDELANLRASKRDEQVEISSGLLLGDEEGDSDYDGLTLSNIWG